MTGVQTCALPISAPVIVEALVRAGVRVMEFAPVPLTLADLLESVGVQAPGTEETLHHA